VLFVSQSVISETISTLEGVIVKALKDFESDLAEAAEGLAGRVAVIDGLLHPCWSWNDKKDLWSGKHKETGHQHQYVCDLAGNLRYISDPLPGKAHDAKAFRDLQLDHHFNESNAFADKGYVGCGVTTPFKKPADGELISDEGQYSLWPTFTKYQPAGPSPTPKTPARPISMPLSLARDLEDVDLGWSVMELVVVGVAFDAVAVCAVSFDHSGVGAVAPWRVGSFDDFWVYATKRGSRPLIGVAPLVSQSTPQCRRRRSL
jgi:hypothetical protein